MIKRTVHIGSPIYLRRREGQLVLQYRKELGIPDKTVPIEDLGVLILDDPQVTITQALLSVIFKRFSKKSILHKSRYYRVQNWKRCKFNNLPMNV